jgi:hypothetical protein
MCFTAEEDHTVLALAGVEVDFTDFADFTDFTVVGGDMMVLWVSSLPLPHGTGNNRATSNATAVDMICREFSTESTESTRSTELSAFSDKV